MRLRGGVVAIVFLWAGAGLQAPASAQTQEQLDKCSGKDGATGDVQISGCTAVIQSGTRVAEAYYARGIGYHGKKDYDRAIADYSEAIRLDPTVASGKAFYGRGGVYGLKEDYDRAIADYNEAIRLDPKLAIAFHNRGHMYAAKEDYDRAISDYSEAIRLDPKRASTFFYRAQMWEEKANPDRAIADYTEANRLDPSDADTIAKLKKLKGQDPEVIR
jgi:tetratricopeptide (TPR) repeat protein